MKVDLASPCTIRELLSGNRLIIPRYQRAYSWDTPRDKEDKSKQTDTFLSDLETHLTSGTTAAYYYGHFLFEALEEKKYGVIDGQQRLTTIVIFLSALYKRLSECGAADEDVLAAKRDTIIDQSVYHLETVDYDDQLFKDYVIHQRKKEIKKHETVSGKKIVQAFDYFQRRLQYKPEEELLRLLNVVLSAICTTHVVGNETEAVQMFIFQNNRGKIPSNLEIIKAQFLFHILLYGGVEARALSEEIRKRFERIYKTIARIEHDIHEDEVLLYSLKVYFNSLWQDNALDTIEKKLSDPSRLNFIRTFTYELSLSFEAVEQFFGDDEQMHMEIHSLVTLGGFGIVLPFILKAYRFGVSMEQICALCQAFESVVLRHRLIGTRADITSRLSEDFKAFTDSHPDVQPILDRIDWLKTAEKSHWWWAYWNNEELERSLQGKMSHGIAKYILWKYELNLENSGKAGYKLSRFDKIEDTHLEHIAPQTENPEAGYDTYDEEFRQEYLDCLGNYLLLSGSHNCSLGNKPFIDKLKTYENTAQQREIKAMAMSEARWTKAMIKKRKEKIIAFLMDSI